jgi:translation initiation factor IF-2
VEKLGDESLQARFLHMGTGNINESDIMLAVASKAIVIGFDVEVDPAASRMADVEGVDIRRYDIIYRLVDDIDKAMKGLLEPEYEEVSVGYAEVRAIFRLPDKTQVAGCQVKDGIAARNARARVKRDNEILFDGQVGSLRRFKDDVREVTTGMECGVGLQNFDGFEVGDIIEFYREEQVEV